MTDQSKIIEEIHSITLSLDPFWIGTFVYLRPSPECLLLPKSSFGPQRWSWYHFSLLWYDLSYFRMVTMKRNLLTFHPRRVGFVIGHPSIAYAFIPHFQSYRITPRWIISSIRPVAFISYVLCPHSRKPPSLAPKYLLEKRASLYWERQSCLIDWRRLQLLVFGVLLFNPGRFGTQDVDSLQFRLDLSVNLSPTKKEKEGF